MFGAIQDSMQKRILHLEPETVGFNNFTPAEYLEEMLDRFMKTRMKGVQRKNSSRRNKGQMKTL